LANHYISVIGMQRDALTARVTALEELLRDSNAAAEERISRAVEPLLERIAELESRIEKTVTVDAARLMLAAETSALELSIERRIGDTVQRAVDRLPPPKDGNDGMSLDNFDMALDGRTFTLSLKCGERVVTKKTTLPFPVYRGIFRHKTKYESADLITFGGSVWLALKDGPTTRPPSAEWQLVVQRGRDAAR
jgi:hypothetical protein